MTCAVRWRFLLNFLNCTRKVILTCWRYHDGKMARHMAVIHHVLSGRAPAPPERAPQRASAQNRLRDGPPEDGTERAGSCRRVQ